MLFLNTEATSLFAKDSSSSITPGMALKRLEEGNLRYASGLPTRPNQDAARRATLVGGQEPFATVISCSDSRVPPELLFDQGLGDLFVVRVAGNVSDVDEVGSIEYGVAHLSTPLLVVLGHRSCGAVTAVLEGHEVHGSIPSLVDNIIPAVERAKAENPRAAGEKLLEAAVAENVFVSMEDLLSRSEATRERVKSGQLQIVGAVYDLETGKVSWLGSHPNLAALLDVSEKSVQEHGAHGTELALHAEGGRSGGRARELVVPNTEPLETNSSSWVVGCALALAAGLFLVWRIARGQLQKWRVGRRLSTGFACVVTLVLLAGFIGYEGMHTAVVDFDQYRKDAQRTIIVAELDTAFLEANVSLGDYLLTRSESQAERVEEELLLVDTIIQRVPEFFDDAEHLTGIRRIREEIQDYADAFQQLRETRSDARIRELVVTMKRNGATIDGELYALLHDVVEAQGELGPVVVRELRESQTIVVSVALCSLVFGVVLSVVTSRSITAPLLRFANVLGIGAEQTASAAAQVSAASQSLAQGASVQASSIEEAAACLEEIASMATNNSENSAKAERLVQTVQQAANAGNENMQSMSAAMDEIKSASSDIGNIVKIIDDIAFQTNILALNAAVEAARAGEAGSGFAVVADEVRNLAQRSASATRDTASKIETSIAKTNLGVQMNRVVASSLQEIVDSIDEIAKVIQEVAVASGEQHSSIDQLNTSVGDMGRVTQASASNAEETAAAAEEMDAQTFTLKETVESLLEMVQGRSAHSLAGYESSNDLAKPARIRSEKPKKAGSDRRSEKEVLTWN